MQPAFKDTIEVDPAVSDDSYSGSDYESAGYNTSTASLSSSAQDYVFENGRRYHTYFGPEKHLMPTDELEQDRLDMHHEIILLIFDNALFKAPISSSPRHILDIGTGTGIWAIDMADKFPDAEVIGTDLTPIKPRWVPLNCRFELDDAESDWTYQPDYFDFIHSRNLSQSIGDWPKLMSKMYRCTRPGGYVEIVEGELSIYSDDNTMADNNPIKIHVDLLRKALATIGRPVADLSKLGNALENAGFVDVQVLKLKQPFGMWPRDPRMKKIGALVVLCSETAFHAYGMAAFTRILGLSKEEAEKICTDALQAIKNRNFHLYNLLYVVYGRKPEFIEVKA